MQSGHSYGQVSRISSSASGSGGSAASVGLQRDLLRTRPDVAVLWLLVEA